MTAAAAHAGLARALIGAASALDFGATADSMRGGAAVNAFPSLDLALIVFRGLGRAPAAANVLFSREHPEGLVASIAPAFGPVHDIRFDRDLQGAGGESIAWLPGADWSRIAFAPLANRDVASPRFVSPYPASLLKLMVAVGIGLAVDAGRCEWPAQDIEPMIVVSDNDATDRMVALLHRCDAITLLHEAFARHGLRTLRLDDTTAAGGWRNADGAGVGHIHMTAWDTVRLLWLIDADAPAAPWLPADTPALLKAETRDRLRAVLERQQLNEILSSGSLRDVPGFVDGIPSSARFAHKTGTTDNYASDAGIVVDGDLHYIVALLTNLGRRYAPHERCATTWRLTALGAAVHRIAKGLR